MDFNLVSTYSPTGDQPEAIKTITDALKVNHSNVTLWGVTGSGKTFTMANVIKNMGLPVLVLSHNKTLAAQLYSEFKAFFPDNAVEYFVSYYDYYQPEAYLPTTDTYIEKDLAINEELEKLRLSTTSALLSGRKDIVVVSSVSCLYGIGNPEDFAANTIELKVGQKISRVKLLNDFTSALYCRSEIEFIRGQFRVKGDTIDIHAAYGDIAFRIVFFDNEIEELYTIDPISGARLDKRDKIIIHPANLFVTTKERINKAIHEIEDDLTKRINEFNAMGKEVEASRIKHRVEYDLEMIREVGYCPGIENYSRYFDGRLPGTRPFCLLDYFPKDFILFIDESHVTLPQIKAMFGGDFSRKTNLVDYAFRLPAAMDNRPLKFSEFEAITGKTVYVSATPTDYELMKSEGVIAEQSLRPTGLLDPLVEVRGSADQIDVIIEEINKSIKIDERIIITTLTKRMAEELYKYLDRLSIRCRYIHSDVDNMERIELIEDFRKGLYDVLIGVNLLREGLDIPQVALVMILDADKEGFLRSERALIQTAGRAARNVNGRVILFADRKTDSMRKMIKQTADRRKKQIEYNKLHGITPMDTARASTTSILTGARLEPFKERNVVTYQDLMDASVSMVAEDGVEYLPKSKQTLEVEMIEAKKRMETAAMKLDFILAGVERDKMLQLQAMIKKIK